ncbi:MAG: hypothetical protein AAF385_07965 [Pseudomonadota bacterium]
MTASLAIYIRAGLELTEPFKPPGMPFDESICDVPVTQIFLSASTTIMTT